MKEIVWCEIYRPKLVAETILPVDLQQTFQAMIKQGEIPNLLLVGRSGVGKTTSAMALLEELGCDYLFIPASLRGNIDTLRNEITQFASSMSFTGKRKYVILDESDYLSYAVQPALRNFMEEYSKNAGFILTANYKNKILPAIQSRCSTIEFNFSKEETQKLAIKFYKRVIEILEKENVTFDKKVIAQYIQTYTDKGSLDFRKVLNELQRYSSTGAIDSTILINSKPESFNELIACMKEKNFTKVRTWIGQNSTNDTHVLLREFYDHANELFNPSFIPELVLILAEAQRDSAFVIDQEICLAAAFAKIMAENGWRS